MYVWLSVGVDTRNMLMHIQERYNVIPQSMCIFINALRVFFKNCKAVIPVFLR